MGTTFELYEYAIESFGKDSFVCLNYNSVVLNAYGYIMTFDPEDIFLIQEISEAAKKAGKATKDVVKAADDFMDKMSKKNELLSEKIAEKMTRAQMDEFESDPKSRKWAFWLVKNAMEWIGIPTAIISVISALGLPLFVFLLIKGALWVTFIKKIVRAAKKKIDKKNDKFGKAFE